MATRLNKSMRDSIARAIVRHAYSDEATAMARQMAHLANITLDYLLAHNVALFHAVPENWMEIADSILVNLGGERLALRFSGLAFGDTFRPYVNRDDETTIGGRHVPSWIKHDIHVIDVRSTLGQALEDHKNKRTALATTITQAYKTAMRTLGRFNTVEQAVKEWPEAEKFLTPHKQTPTVRLPAVISADINRTLHLPPEGDNDETDLHK